MTADVPDAVWVDARKCKGPSIRETSRLMTAYLKGRGDDQDWHRKGRDFKLGGARAEEERKAEVQRPKLKV